VLGSIAVLATLSYFALQIRQGHIAQNAASSESVSQGFNPVKPRLSTDARLTKIIIKGSHDIESLDSVEPYRHLVTMQMPPTLTVRPDTSLGAGPQPALRWIERRVNRARGAQRMYPSPDARTVMSAIDTPSG